MNDEELSNRLASRIANLVLNSPIFKRMLREICLEVQVRSEIQRSQDSVKCFLDCCRERSINVSLSDHDEVLFDQPDLLTGELCAILRLYRSDIVRFLIHCREAEAQMAKRLAPKKNGVHK